MATSSADPRIDILLRIIDEAYDRRSWHGTNLRGSIRGLSPRQASWRPAPGRHNIWEIVVHAAYWKYTVRRRLLNEKRGSFPLAGSNWFERPVKGTDDATQWASDVALLGDMHRLLRRAVAGAGAAAGDLGRAVDGGKNSAIWLISGIAAHDLYHAGQIQLLKRLQTASPARNRR